MSVFAHQTCNDLFMCTVSSLASAGSCRLHCLQKQVYLDITIDRCSSLFLASDASAIVIMSLRMIFMRYGTKLADYSPYFFRTVAQLISQFIPAFYSKYQLFLQHLMGGTMNHCFRSQEGSVHARTQTGDGVKPTKLDPFWLGVSAKTILHSSILQQQSSMPDFST